MNSTNKTLKNKKKNFLTGRPSQAENIEIDDDFLNKITTQGVNWKKMIIQFI